MNDSGKSFSLKKDFNDFLNIENMGVFLFVVFIISQLGYNGGLISAVFIIVPIELLFVYIIKKLFDSLGGIGYWIGLFDKLSSKIPNKCSWVINIVFFIVIISLFFCLCIAITNCANFVRKDVLHLPEPQSHYKNYDDDYIQGVPMRFQ